MNFIFEQKLTESQTFFTKQGMRKAQAEGLSFNKYQQEMISGGAGYKRLDMLADWNRGKTVFRAKRSDKMAKLDRYYDVVALPLMAKRDITPKEYYGVTKVKGRDEFEDSDEYEEWMDWFAREDTERQELYGANW